MKPGVRETEIARGWRRAAIAMAALAAALPLVAGAATPVPDGPFVFHSPNDDGTHPGCPAVLGCQLDGIAPPDALNLYIDPGPNSNPEGPCAEVCGVHAVIEIEGAFFTEFEPESGVTGDPACIPDPATETCPLPPGTDKLEVVASFASQGIPEVGPARRIGTLYVDTPAPSGDPAQGAAISLNGIEIVDADFQSAPMSNAAAARFVAVPEPTHALLLGAGGLGLAALHARRQRRAGRPAPGAGTG